MADYKVIAGKEFNLPGTKVSGHNCSFQYEEGLLPAFKILMENKEGKQYNLILKVSEGVCSSGWCTATFGHYSILELENKDRKDREVYTLKPKESNAMITIEGDETIENDLFTVSLFGGDEYYPRGDWNIKEESWELIS